MNIDFSAWRTPQDLIAAIWTARRADRRDLKPEIVPLLDHDDPAVREEVISLLFVKWADSMMRDKLVEIFQSDPDFGVRARAAGAIARLSDENSRRADRDVLRPVVLNPREDTTLRQAAYEALFQITYGRLLILEDGTDLDEDVDLDWVRED